MYNVRSSSNLPQSCFRKRRIRSIWSHDRVTSSKATTDGIPTRLECSIKNSFSTFALKSAKNTFRGKSSFCDCSKKHIKDHFQDRVHGMEPIKIFFNWSKALEAQSSSCHNYFLKIGYSRPLFVNFRLFYLTAQRADNLLPILIFDTRISGVGSARSAIWATNTVLLPQLFVQS